MRPFLFVSFFVSACLQIGGDTQRLVESNSAEIEAGTAYDIEIEPPLELPRPRSSPAVLRYPLGTVGKRKDRFDRSVESQRFPRLCTHLRGGISEREDALESGNELLFGSRADRRESCTLIQPIEQAVTAAELALLLVRLTLGVPFFVRRSQSNPCPATERPGTSLPGSFCRATAGSAGTRGR